MIISLFFCSTFEYFQPFHVTSFLATDWVISGVSVLGMGAALAFTWGQRRKLREAGIRDADDANIWLNRGEGVIGGKDIVLGQGIEKGGFTHIRQSDNSNREAHEE